MVAITTTIAQKPSSSTFKHNQEKNKRKNAQRELLREVVTFIDRDSAQIKIAKVPS